LKAEKVNRADLREMEQGNGVVKHMLLVKFKDGVSENQIDELTKGYANLVNLIEPMKSLHW
jgi:hypothetical protein